MCPWPVLLFRMGVNSEINTCTLLHTLLCSHFVYTHTMCHVSGRIRGKGDVIFDDIIADVQGVQISGCGSSELALHSCPVLSVCPALPFIPLCQLCQCVRSRNSLTLTPISSASLTVPSQIEHGKTLPPTFQPYYYQPFGWPHQPSHFAKAELQPHM